MNRSQGLVTHSNDVCFWAQVGRGKVIVADDRGCELLHAREPGVKHMICTRSEVIDVGRSCLFHLIGFIKFVFCKSACQFMHSDIHTPSLATRLYMGGWGRVNVKRLMANASRPKEIGRYFRTDNEALISSCFWGAAGIK